MPQRDYMISSHRDLTVWQKAMGLVEAVYRLIKLLPSEEVYGLSAQMRRAAVSIPSNIAEGYGRKAAKEYARFLSIARGSNLELETQLLLCVRLGYIPETHIQDALNQSEEIGRMLNALISKLQPKD